MAKAKSKAKSKLWAVREEPGLYSWFSVFVGNTPPREPKGGWDTGRRRRIRFSASDFDWLFRVEHPLIGKPVEIRFADEE